MSDAAKPAAGGPADVAADWAAMDAAAAVVVAPGRRFFHAEGEERRQFLHGQTTAHVESLAPGEGRAALVLNAQGRPLALGAVYEDGERTWIATTAEHSGAARAALSRFLVADDCDFTDDLDATCLAVVGPRAAAVLDAAGVQGAASLPAWGMLGAVVAGTAVTIFSRGDLRVPSYDVMIAGAAGVAEVVLEAIVAAGARRCGAEALEILRIESGTPRYGADVDETRIAVEARLQWAIHFAKGCYVGQEVVERAVSRGRINHELCLLKLAGGVGPGARVDGGSDSDVVTSVAESPRLGAIALAYLPRAKAEAGGAVTLIGDDRTVEAAVLPWPRARVLEGRS
ncbi:MAG: folate-binding protein YgfZ [Candidatus Binatia bacterium]